MTEMTTARPAYSMPHGLKLFLNRPIGGALMLLAFAVLTRMRDFGNPVAHVDEQYYLLVGDRILHGARLYIDLWDRKPPGLFLLFAGFRLLPGDGFLAYQLVGTACTAATGWLIWLAARRMALGFPAGLAAGRPISYGCLCSAAGAASRRSSTIWR